MHEYFMECELGIKKASHAFDTAFDMFAIASTEIAVNRQNGTITESSDATDMLIQEAKKFTDSVKSFFRNIVETFKKMIRDVTLKFQTTMTQRQVNKRIKEIKEQLLADRIEWAKEQKIECFDAEKYSQAYTEYVNTFIAEYKKLFNGNYENLDEYNEAADECDKMVARKFEDLKLDNSEAFVLSMYIDKALGMTEKEINMSLQVLKAQEKYYEEFAKYLEERAFIVDEATMIADMKRVATQISMKSTQAVKKVVDSPIDKLGKIIGSIGRKKPKKENDDK